MSNALTITARTAPVRNQLILDNIRQGVRAKTWSKSGRPADSRAARRDAKRDLRRGAW